VSHTPYPQIHVEVLSPQCGGIWRWSLWEIIRFKLFLSLDEVMGKGIMMRLAPLLRRYTKPGVMVHTCNPSTQEASLGYIATPCLKDPKRKKKRRHQRA
jgi:hypothetical protein